MKRLLPLFLVLAGCATYAVAAAIVPTLEVTNLTDDYLTVYVEGRSLGRVPGMSTVCVKLTHLPPRQVVVGFRALANGIKRSMPTDYATDVGWALTISGASYDGGFFAKPAPRCRA